MYDLTRLWRFPGGLQLAANTDESTRLPSMHAALPKQLMLSLRWYDGSFLTPLVGVHQPVLKGQPIARHDDGHNLHAPSSGTVRDIGWCPSIQSGTTAAPAITIETDGAERWCETAQPLPDFQNAQPSALLARIRAAGVVGLGGAVFPTADKLAAGNIELLILNGAECEPYISCDDVLMRERAAAVVSGALIMRYILQAAQTVIALEDNKPEAYQALAATLAELAPVPSVVLRKIPSFYPSGGERQLIRIVSGVDITEDSYPVASGIICQNVATAAAVHDAVTDGRPLISRYVTLTGAALARPRVLQALIGTPVGDLIAQCGGYTAVSRRLIMGGAMMGSTLADDALPIGKGSHCILVQPAVATPPATPCIGCGACVGVCPAQLLPQTLYRCIEAGDYDQAQTHRLSACIECGCCAAVCPSHIALVDYYRRAKTEIRSRDSRHRQAEHARQRFEARRQRLQREADERAVRLTQKKEQMRQVSRTAGQNPSPDAKKTAIEAALARTRAKKTATSSRPPEDH